MFYRIIWFIFHIFILFLKRIRIFVNHRSLLYYIMEKELPKIDFPENWLIGTDISKELLSLYCNYPVRLKCEIFALCMDGEIEVSVNLNRISIRKNDVITLVPGTIFQIHSVEGNLKIYFLGFSSNYIEQASRSHSMLDLIYFTLGRPVLSIKTEGANLFEDYLKLLIRMFEFFPEKVRTEMAPNLYANIHKGISLLYRGQNEEQIISSKSDQICRNFAQLVMQHYNQTRNVAWYAEKLNISHAHLCTTVKQITGKTCGDIISSMVIMDAKSQLKSTQLSIQDISDALNFANMSFFGKYFKRYVGMSPLEYRNKG